ncbi:uncharacterized protein CTRU02_213568 [Colletotrichum truncatum]|uniref:Uncharacterized protein n=1 Tax=Colletotrichum truncatum TaxID=5467 RepID=A0ACC3YG34_COLTU|nr:uncharacterized protein CTRU02_12469 [Colletotrichum truncatum]KAF6784480.1 hypothetical protein CTRU02_12469 [Colletotrichum truncatum]
MVDMDDATRLIGDLHQKLADLDHKVAAYRQDMATEFHRYSKNLLQNLPNDLQAEVDRAVAASYHNYPALSPALCPPRDHPDSPPPPPTDDTEKVTETAPDRRESTPTPQSQATHSAPPSSVVANAGTATLTSPDSAHDRERERERELYGLFTPSYLPLLDGAQPSPITNHSPVLSPPPKPPANDYEMDPPNSRQDSGRRPVQVSVAATQTPDRPNHERRATDDTTSSGTSEQSDSKVRRSALRRTSSGSKTPASPRRVRFEFEGGEVLPTASPQSSEPSLVLSHTLANSRSPTPPQEESMSVESLLGPDEDLGPPPKKVSSSQALRALSRAPLDANTVWTVVNPDAQGSDAEKENGSMATSDSESSLHANNSVQTQPKYRESPKSPVVERGRTLEQTSPASPEIPNMARDDDDSDDSSSDDGFLAMAKPKSFANKKAILSPLSRSPTRITPVPQSPSPEKTGSSTEAKTLARQIEVEDEDDDDMFHFEGLSAPPKPRARPAPIQEEDEDEDEEDDEHEVNQPVAQTLYSTSPAVSIPKPPEPQIPAHLISGSVGSFRGRPVTMPVVKNPEIYQQAASLGDVSTFIGGLDGRSGVDDGDLNSYRASVGQVLFSGTPRSLTERMMMEEAQSQRRAAAQRPR